MKVFDAEKVIKSVEEKVKAAFADGSLTEVKYEDKRGFESISLGLAIGDTTISIYCNTYPRGKGDAA